MDESQLTPPVAPQGPVWTQPQVVSQATQWSQPRGGAEPTEHHARHHRRWLWLSISLLILAALGVGGYLAWSRGFLPLPFLTPASAKVVDKMITSIGAIENASYSLRSQLVTEPRAAGAQPFIPEVGNTNQANTNTTSLTKAQKDTKVLADVRQYLLAAATYADAHDDSYPPCPNQAEACDPATITGLTSYFSGQAPTAPTGRDPYVYQLVAAEKPDGAFKITFTLTVGTAGYAAGTCTGTSTGITCAQATTNLNANLNVNAFEIEPVGPEVGLGSVSSVFPGGLDLDYLYQSFPADIAVDTGVTLSLQTDRSLKDADGSIRIDGTYTGSDASAAFDVEARKVGEDFYALIAKFPGLFFFDVSGIKGKWIKFSPGDANWYATSQDLDAINMRGALEDLQRVLRAIFDHEFLQVETQLPPETINGFRSEHYRIQANLDRLPDVYRALIEDQRSRGEDVSDLEKDLKKLDDPTVRQMLERIRDDTTLEVWIDRTKGYLRQLRWSLRIVPPDRVKKLKEKQVTATATLTLDKINEPTVVEVPSPTIDLDEATRLVTGISKEEQQFDKQDRRVSKVRSSLTDYKSGLYGIEGSAKNPYPEQLSDLVAHLADMKSKCEQRRSAANENANRGYRPSCSSYSYYSLREQELIDVYTNGTFGYTREGDDYKLTYTMHPVAESSSIYRADEYADGVNTATSRDLSLEKVSRTEQYRIDNPITSTNRNSNSNINSSVERNPDSDQDGLDDAAEKRYGTDPAQADTDGDGYRDQIEVLNGYDPLGSGRQADGVWSTCINPSTLSTPTCRAYCTSVGKHCWNAGTTTGGASAQGAETWDDGPACSTASGTTKWNTCDFQTAATDARWKCFCK